MLLLVHDVETTGLDHAADYVTEHCSALYSVERRSVLWLGSTLCSAPSERVSSVAALTGILAEEVELMSAVDAGAPAINETLTVAHRLASIVKAQVAHNAGFDRPFIERLWARLGLEAPTTPWVCSVEDIAYPRQSPSRKLGHMALDHGLAVTGWHRAHNDVLLLCRLLGQVPNLDAQVDIALGPRSLFVALVPYERKDEAKQAGFRWDPDKKRWWKKLPSDTTLEATAERPFRLARLPG